MVLFRFLQLIFIVPKFRQKHSANIPGLIPEQRHTDGSSPIGNGSGD
jgi:hypothetical protein